MSQKDDTKKGFDFVKKDISAVTGWIKHLDSEKNMQKKDIELIKDKVRNAPPRLILRK